MSAEDWPASVETVDQAKVVLARAWPSSPAPAPLVASFTGWDAPPPLLQAPEVDYGERPTGAHTFRFHEFVAAKGGRPGRGASLPEMLHRDAMHAYVPWGGESPPASGTRVSSAPIDRYGYCAVVGAGQPRTAEGTFWVTSEVLTARALADEVDAFSRTPDIGMADARRLRAEASDYRAWADDLEQQLAYTSMPWLEQLRRAPEPEPITETPKFVRLRAGA